MINDVSKVLGPGQAIDTGGQKSTVSFSETLAQAFDNTSENLQKADDSILRVNTGGPVDLHEVMIAMEKADISLRMLVQVRNKAVEAYQEIMRMQV